MIDTAANTFEVEPLLLSIADAARMIGIPKATLLTWAWQGRVPCVRLGRRRMFRRKDLLDWLDKQYCPERPGSFFAHPKKDRYRGGGERPSAGKEGK